MMVEREPECGTTGDRAQALAHRRIMDVLELGGLSAPEKAVLLVLAISAGPDGLVDQTINQLARNTSYSIRAVRNAVRDVQRAGHISRYHCNGIGTLTRVHPRVGDGST